MFSNPKRALFWAALATAACRPAAAGPDEAALLRAHLTLAQGGEAYLQAERDALVLYVKGVELKRHAVERLWGPPPGAGVAAVVSVTAAVEPPQVTVDAERAAREFDKVGSVASKDEIVSVREMPETFLVRFSDGSQWWVTSGGWEGPAHAVGRQILQYRAGFDLVRARFGSGSGTLAFYRTDRQTAQKLFWLIREEMAVIQ